MLIDTQKLDTLTLHQFDCYFLGMIEEKARMEMWPELFEEMPSELKNASSLQCWEFYEKLIDKIQKYMVDTYPENETRDGPWYGREILYMKFILPTLNEVFHNTEAVVN